MGKGTDSKSTNWYVYHQDRIKYYESQQAALVAIDLIIPNCEDGIWDRNEYYISMGYEREEIVDNELFAHYYSANALRRDRTLRVFSIDIYVKNKEDWILKYGSSLLQQSLRAGYDCNDGYLAERLPTDYPDFTINRWEYKKVDTPSEKCLYACSGYQYSYCSIDKEDYYITIDNYLGKYQLVKLIDPNLEITRAGFSIEGKDSAVKVNDDKDEWILEYGSDLLQQSFMAGYDCNDRYLQERIAIDYPGFTVNSGNYRKVDSPDETCLYACLGYEDSYCSSSNKCYYVTIDNFLGKYQLIKPIESLFKVTEKSSISEIVLNILVRTKIDKYKISTNSFVVLLVTSVPVIILGLIATFCVLNYEF
jgi:hypothetical protein